MFHSFLSFPLYIQNAKYVYVYIFLTYIASSKTTYRSLKVEPFVVIHESLELLRETPIHDQTECKFRNFYQKHRIIEHHLKNFIILSVNNYLQVISYLIGAELCKTQ